MARSSGESSHLTSFASPSPFGRARIPGTPQHTTAGESGCGLPSAHRTYSLHPPFLLQIDQTGFLLLHVRAAHLVLQTLPGTLKYLLVKVTGGTEQEAVQTDLFNPMCITDSSSDLWPNLSSMLYAYSSIDEFPADAFFAMAESRF